MSKLSCISHVLLVSSLFCASMTQAQESIPTSVSSALQISGIPLQNIGLYVQEANGNGKVMAAANVNVPMNPASTMKLVTTGAALELLGPTYSWKTQAYTTGQRTGGVLQGDLIFKGSGDPKMVLENFWLFLRQIRAKGIKDIRGNVLLDRSIYDDSLSHDSSSFDGDPLKPYNVGPDALLLNYKALTFQFEPDDSTGVVNVVIDPPLAGYPVKPPRLDRKGQCGDWTSKLGSSFEGDGANFGGTFATACGEKIWYVNPYKMSSAQYFGAVFRQMWSDLGGTFSGTVKTGMVPAGAQQFAEWSSVTLPEVIRDINKYSNNVMARQLLLTIGSEMYKTPATPESGARAVQSWMVSKNIPTNGFIIDNGSGLSRTARISAATMGGLLRTAFQSPTMPEFISSMPLVGYDGTMRKRLKTQSVAGQAHMKTGTLNDVRALAGYVLAASGKYYSVVFMFNGGNAPRGAAAQDALLQWVYENG